MEYLRKTKKRIVWTRLLFVVSFYPFRFPSKERGLCERFHRNFDSLFLILWWFLGCKVLNSNVNEHKNVNFIIGDVCIRTLWNLFFYLIFIFFNTTFKRSVDKIYYIFYIYLFIFKTILISMLTKTIQ